jgi:hypothetical protein
MVTTEIPELEVNIGTKRESTSINIDPELWREVRKTAIDMDISATDFFEQALREKLAAVKGKSTKRAN